MNKKEIEKLTKSFDKNNEWYSTEFEVISKKLPKNKELSYCDFLRIRNYKLRVRTKEKPENS